jgi:hypothetical protein
MSLLTRLSSLWRNLFHKSRKEQELTEEIDTYLAMLIEQKIGEGLDPGEARRAALVELGGKEQVKEKVRDVSAGYQLETLWQDLRYGLQMLGRNPGFTAVAVLSLALGIGANTAIFSLMDAALFKMLPVKNPEQLFLLERRGVRKDDNEGRSFSYALLEQLRAQHGTQRRRDERTRHCGGRAGLRCAVGIRLWHSRDRGPSRNQGRDATANCNTGCHRHPRWQSTG